MKGPRDELRLKKKGNTEYVASDSTFCSCAVLPKLNYTSNTWRISSQTVLCLFKWWSHFVFALFVPSRWPYWRAWSCQRIPNSRISFLPPSLPWIQTNDVRCSLRFPPSSFSRCPASRIRFNVKPCSVIWDEGNKSQLLLAVTKLIGACREEDWSYCGLPYFVHIGVLSLWTPTLMLYSSLYLKPETSPRGLKLN